jgi:hypothetical protein
MQSPKPHSDFLDIVYNLETFAIYKLLSLAYIPIWFSLLLTITTLSLWVVFDLLYHCIASKEHMQLGDCSRKNHGKVDFSEFTFDCHRLKLKSGRSFFRAPFFHSDEKKSEYNLEQSIKCSKIAYRCCYILSTLLFIHNKILIWLQKVVFANYYFCLLLLINLAIIFYYHW